MCSPACFYNISFIFLQRGADSRDPDLLELGLVEVLVQSAGERDGSGTRRLLERVSPPLEVNWRTLTDNNSCVVYLRV